MNDRNNKGQFNPGNSIGGRPRSGRSKAIELLDLICGNETNLEKLKDALQVEFDKDPIKFFKDFVMTTAPKEMDLAITNNEWATKTPADIVEEMTHLTVGEANDSK